MQVSAISPSPLLQSYIKNPKPAEGNSGISTPQTSSTDKNNTKDNSKKIMFGALGAAVAAVVAAGAIFAGRKIYLIDKMKDLIVESKPLQKTGEEFLDRADDVYQFAQKQIEEAKGIITKLKDGALDEAGFKTGRKLNENGSETLYEFIEEYSDNSLVRKIRYKNSKPLDISIYGSHGEDRVFVSDNNYTIFLKDVSTDCADKDILLSKEAYRFDGDRLVRSATDCGTDIKKRVGLVSYPEKTKEFTYENKKLSQIVAFKEKNNSATFNFDKEGSLEKIAYKNYTFDAKKNAILRNQTTNTSWTATDPETIEDLED